MKVYTTEAEQIQALQNWFKQYGKMLLIGILCVVGVSASGYYWNQRNITYANNASGLYEQLQRATNVEEKTKLAQQLSNDYSKTIYGKIATLVLTNQKANQHQWQEVEGEYKKLYDSTSNWPDLEIIIFENWLRTKLELGQADSAYQEIKSAEEKFAKNFPLNFYNLKGDILAKLDKKSEAVDAYNKAIDAHTLNPQVQQQTAQFVNWIVLKRNDLLEAQPLASS